MIPEDRKLLTELLAWADNPEHEDDPRKERWEEAFRDMLEVGQTLSPLQKKWVARIHDWLCEGVHYENAFSAGKVPIGKALATPIPEVLKKPLPLKPPGRK